LSQKWSRKSLTFRKLTFQGWGNIPFEKHSIKRHPNLFL
jgi:hypothetical protein